MIGIVDVASRPEWVEEFQQSCDMLECPWRLVKMNHRDWRSQLKGLSLILWRAHQGDQKELKIAKERIPLIERMNIRCFPSASMIYYYDDKAREAQFFKDRHLATPETMVGKDPQELFAFLQEASYPLVAKTPSGANSKNVHLIRTAEEGKKLVRFAFGKLPRFLWPGYGHWKAFRNGGAVLFQEYIPSEGDWRITTFGKDTVSVVKRWNRPGDFRASGSGIRDHVVSGDVPLEICHLLLQVGQEKGFTSMAYDLLPHMGKWRVLEMSYTFPLHSIFTETLFQIADNKASSIKPLRIGVLHLRAMRDLIGDEIWTDEVMKQ